MYNPLHPPPAPPAFGSATVIPERRASILSKLIFHWLSPLLSVGFTRPLEVDDLWQLDEHNKAKKASQLLERHFYRGYEVKTSSDEQKDATATDATPGEKEEFDSGNDDLEKGTSKSTKAVKGEKKKQPSLLLSIHAVFWRRIWLGGLFKLISDTLQTTSPLVNKALLNWLTVAFLFANTTGAGQADNTSLANEKPRGIGYGLGLAIALFAMQELSSFFVVHYNRLAMSTGLTVRAGIVSTIFRKSLRLSNRARNEHSVGKITTMISTDATRLDFVSAIVHNLWTAPIQIIIGVALLIANLGVSALVGLAIILISFPIQGPLVNIMFQQRKKSVGFTDKRVRMTNEILQGIRLLKSYAWEDFYAEKVKALRKRELKAIRTSAFARATLISNITFVPTAAAVLSFITYSLTGHQLTPGVIFSSLQLFNVIRTPMIFLPVVLAGSADAAVALGRISKYLLAEELGESFMLEEDSKWAIEIKNGSFVWETAAPTDDPKKGKQKGKKSKAGGDAKDDLKKKEMKEAKRGKSLRERLFRSKKTASNAPKPSNEKDTLPIHSSGASSLTVLPTPQARLSTQSREEDEKPFELRNLNLQIPKGSFVAIVGRVGTGKSSLLQSIIGEMRKTSGEIVMGGTIAYVPQTAWIMNASLRNNVLFGQEDEEDRFQEIVEACSLQQDIDMLPDGDATEIGEKGINLSGGQKARVSMARAAYSPSDTILLDDCLSAVDAHVGKAILEKCLLTGPLSDRTRILVTHALHVLPSVDRIIVIDNGQVAEEGTYAELMADSPLDSTTGTRRGMFKQLMNEYGSLEKTSEDVDNSKAIPAAVSEAGIAPVAAKKAAKAGAQVLMTAEERNTGAVTGETYLKYFKAGGSIAWGPAIIISILLTQAAQVVNNLFLGWWSAESLPGFSNNDYMGAYAGLGAAQAIMTFVTSFSVSILGLRTSLTLFGAALYGVLRSPVSFFDTTPMGRIISRLSKDQDTLDTQLPSSAYQFFSVSSSVVGTVFLVFYTFPLLGIIFAPLSVFYYFVAIFYRRTSVETKRLDSILRSNVYAAISESLSGLATVRAYRDEERFINKLDNGIDGQNRAYYMTIILQQWLGIRLDTLGNILVLGISLFAVGFRKTVNPSKIGVVLSYALSITQVFSQMISQYAMMEQNMNAAERILVYTELPKEGIREKPSDPAPTAWPKGSINFSDVSLAYREGLPLVLKGVNFSIQQGEKIGVVGRTGAGKSSLLQALFRVVELHSGKIEIDGVDISTVGLDTLRHGLALVPQDPVLFLGTVRENLDPLKTRTDAELIQALRRSWLLPPQGATDPVAEVKFGLDSPVSDEGSNFSAGERQLIALCRALVKASPIIVLDEASSSVDVETDAKVQQTIRKEFNSSTLLCIAHRLNTIVYYDRILVMDAGDVAEFDSPLTLFDQEGSIFRSLCDEAGLSRADIMRIRSGEDPLAVTSRS